jgi:hypothetical protein
MTSVLTMNPGTPVKVATQPPVFAFQPSGSFSADGGRYEGTTPFCSATGPYSSPMSAITAIGLSFSASNLVISSFEDMSVSVRWQADQPFLAQNAWMDLP